MYLSGMQDLGAQVYTTKGLNRDVYDFVYSVLLLLFIYILKPAFSSLHVLLLMNEA